MNSIFKKAQFCALGLFTLIFIISTNSLKAQTQIGMQLLMPVEASLDSSGVMLKTPFADEESIKDDIYTEKYRIKISENEISRDRGKYQKQEKAKREDVFLIVHYL